MKKIFNFIFWPALAGLVFSVTLLQIPRAVSIFPGLAAYFPSQQMPQTELIHTVITSYSDIIKLAAPAVVSINSQQSLSQNYTLDGPIDEANSLGSGVILSQDGYIVTSFHVFATKDTLQLKQKTTITLKDGRVFDARYIYRDIENDLVLLKIKAENLPYLEIDPFLQQVEVGDTALVIGNPRNIGQSVSSGIISAFLKTDDSYLIQTDAAINPGNSGGALINASGDLVGISASIISESGGSEGIGLAVPAYKAKELLQSYLDNGPSGYLGVDAEALTLVAGEKQFGRTIQGLLITGITENSPAEEAGIQPGDLVTAINGKDLAIQDPRDTAVIGSMISRYGPEAIVTFDILRQQEMRQISVKLEEGGSNPYGIVLYETEAFPINKPEQQLETETSTR